MYLYFCFGQCCLLFLNTDLANVDETSAVDSFSHIHHNQYHLHFHAGVCRGKGMKF